MLLYAPSPSVCKSWNAPCTVWDAIGHQSLGQETNEHGHVCLPSWVGIHLYTFFFKTADKSMATNTKPAFRWQLLGSCQWSTACFGGQHLLVDDWKAQPDDAAAGGQVWSAHPCTQSVNKPPMHRHLLLPTCLLCICPVLSPMGLISGEIPQPLEAQIITTDPCCWSCWCHAEHQGKQLTERCFTLT